MSLYFPEGLNGPCLQNTESTCIGSLTTLLPLVNKVIFENDLNDTEVLICTYWKRQAKVRYFWGSRELYPTPEKEVLRIALDERCAFIIFTENMEIREQLIEYFTSGNLEE